MNTRNYVVEALNAYYHKQGKAIEVKAVYEEAQMRFPFMHILIAMANTETVKAIDMIDERNMRLHLVKRHLTAYEKTYDAYTSYMRRHMTEDAWALLQDYARFALNSIEYKCVLLRQACYNYLKKMGVKDPSLLAQCEVAFLMWEIEVDTFCAYFDSYKAKCGVDFRRDYSYADMTRCHDEWLNVTNELAKGAKGIDFNDDRRCRDAWNDLKEQIDDTDFFNKAAGEALVLNPKMKEKYKDLL